MESLYDMTQDDMAEADEARRAVLEEREREHLELLRARRDEDRGEP